MTPNQCEIRICFGLSHVSSLSVVSDQCSFLDSKISSQGPLVIHCLLLDQWVDSSRDITIGVTKVHMRKHFPLLKLIVRLLLEIFATFLNCERFILQGKKHMGTFKSYDFNGNTLVRKLNLTAIFISILTFSKCITENKPLYEYCI